MRVTTGRFENAVSVAEPPGYAWRDFVPAEVADRLLAAVLGAKETIFALTINIGDENVRDFAYGVVKRLDAEIAATQK